MQDNLVSVIIPTYNRGYIIDKALESLRMQTFQDFEVIVVDDGSTDNTEEIVNRFSELKIVYIKLEKNLGANHARNVGITQAQGKYLAFLDSDNEWLPLNLTAKINLLQDASNQVGFVFGSFYVWRGERKEIFQPAGVENQAELKRTILKGNVIDTNTVLVRRECFQKVGFFDEELKRLQDWDMFGRILFDGDYQAVYCKEPLVINKIQKDSITMNNEIYLASKNRIIQKRWMNYRKEYLVNDIVDDYLFEQQQWEGISIYDRMQSLFEFDISKKEWDQYWNAKIKQIERLSVSDRNLHIFNMWALLEEKNVGIDEWFVKHNIGRIAIYGYGYVGRHFLHEIELAGMRVEFIVDKNEKVRNRDISVFHTTEGLPIVDLIVVTAVAYYQEIKDELEKKTTAKIISLEEILYSLLKKE